MPTKAKLWNGKKVHWEMCDSLKKKSAMNSENLIICIKWLQSIRFRKCVFSHVVFGTEWLMRCINHIHLFMWHLWYTSSCIPKNEALDSCVACGSLQFKAVKEWDTKLLCSNSSASCVREKSHLYWKPVLLWSTEIWLK